MQQRQQGLQELQLQAEIIKKKIKKKSDIIANIRSALMLWKGNDQAT